MRGLELARAADRAHFAAHPRAVNYVRALIPGESPLMPGAAGRVAVALAAPDVFVRALVLTGEAEDAARREVEATALLLRRAFAHAVPQGRGVRA